MGQFKVKYFKLKAQILQMRYQNVQEGLKFSVERFENFNLSSYFHQSKIVIILNFYVNFQNIF